MYVNADSFLIEVLNSIKCNGLPNHDLKWKIGALVMMLKKCWINSAKACGIKKNFKTYEVST